MSENCGQKSMSLLVSNIKRKELFIMALTLTERPNTFDEVKGQNEEVENLRKQVLSGKISHFYTFEGNRGSGKTTISRILAKAINCEKLDDRGNPCCKCPACMQIQNGNSPDYIELDAASNNGVDSVRALIDSTSYVPMNLRYKVILIDEAHMLSTGAFNAFLKTLEEPPEYCVFIMATTDINKIPITVQSRAMIYQFKRISVDVIKDHVITVAQKYNMDIEPEAATIIAKKATGAMRDALSDLEKCLLVGDKITVQNVMDICGIADNERLMTLVENLCDYERTGAFSQVEELYAAGRDLKYCVSECLTILTDIIKYKNSKDEHILCQTEAYNEKVVQLAERTTNARLSSVADGLMKLKTELSLDPSRNNVLIHISQMCEPALDVSLLFEKIRQLESVVSRSEHISTDNKTTQDVFAHPSKMEQPKVEDSITSKKESIENKAVDKPQPTPEKIEEKGKESSDQNSSSNSANVVSSGNGMFHFKGAKKKEKPAEKVVENTKKPSAENAINLFGSLLEPKPADDFEEVSQSENIPFDDDILETRHQPIAEKMETVVENETLHTEKQPEAEKAALNDLLENDVIRHAINNYCTISEDECTIISSDFAPIVKIIDSYIKIFQLTGIMAKHSCK